MPTVFKLNSVHFSKIIVLLILKVRIKDNTVIYNLLYSPPETDQFPGMSIQIILNMLYFKVRSRWQVWLPRILMEISRIIFCPLNMHLMLKFFRLEFWSLRLTRHNGYLAESIKRWFIHLFGVSNYHIFNNLYRILWIEKKHWVCAHPQPQLFWKVIRQRRICEWKMNKIWGPINL